MEHTGEFSCSEPLVNQLQHNILWGMKGNFVDIPTDCPQRDERMGWTGDAQIFCRTACFLMDTYTFFEKWLQDVAADQTPEGGVPHVVPDIISGKKAVTGCYPRGHIPRRHGRMWRLLTHGQCIWYMGIRRYWKSNTRV